MSDEAHTSGVLEEQSSDPQQEVNRPRATLESLTDALCNLSAGVSRLLSKPHTSLGLLQAGTDARAD